jgi:hypothetical protein
VHLGLIQRPRQLIQRSGTHYIRPLVHRTVANVHPRIRANLHEEGIFDRKN